MWALTQLGEQMQDGDELLALRGWDPLQEGGYHFLGCNVRKIELNTFRLNKLL